MAEWTFLTNHALVLIHINRSPGMTAREMSLQIGITERAVRKINADLETQGYLKKTKIGRRVEYQVNDRMPFRHPSFRNHPIQNLITAVSGRKSG